MVVAEMAIPKRGKIRRGTPRASMRTTETKSASLNDEATDEEESDGSEASRMVCPKKAANRMMKTRAQRCGDGRGIAHCSVATHGTSGTLTVYSMAAPSGLIRDLDVKIDLDHSCSKDLAATLTSPSGTTIVLFDLRELVVCSSDMEDTLFDYEASVLITRGSTPFRGLHRPTGFCRTLWGRCGGCLDARDPG